MKKDKNIDDVIEELTEYANLEGSELGGLAGSLIEMYESYMDYVSDEFLKALEKEMRDQLDNFKENSAIVEEEITETITRKVKELVWSN